MTKLIFILLLFFMLPAVYGQAPAIHLPGFNELKALQTSTIAGFETMVEKYGFVPAGTRVDTLPGTLTSFIYTPRTSDTAILRIERSTDTIHFTHNDFLLTTITLVTKDAIVYNQLMDECKKLGYYGGPGTDIDGAKTIFYSLGPQRAKFKLLPNKTGEFSVSVFASPR